MEKEEKKRSEERVMMWACVAVLDQPTPTAIQMKIHALYPIVVLRDLPQWCLMLAR